MQCLEVDLCEEGITCQNRSDLSVGDVVYQKSAQIFLRIVKISGFVYPPLTSPQVICIFYVCFVSLCSTRGQPQRPGMLLLLIASIFLTSSLVCGFWSFYQRSYIGLIQDVKMVFCWFAQINLSYVAGFDCRALSLVLLAWCRLTPGLLFYGK